MNYFLLIYYKCIFMLFIMENILYFSDGHGSSTTKILLISLDGFRHDYFDLSDKSGINLIHFKDIFLKGVKSDHLENLFITRTFPNHISIITGCYEESHGIVDNVFFDPLINESFSMKNITQNFQSKWFSAVEPIWVTNQKNGHKSAIIYWPGQLAPFRDEYYPSYTFGLYSSNVSLNYKIDIMLNWLKEKDTTLGILYHPHPDQEGHKYGSNSSALLQVISDIDSSFGYLLASIDRNNLKDVLNVVVVSDHGMSDISSSKRVFMDQYISLNLYHINRQESYTMWGFWPRDNVNVTSIFDALRTVPHITTYLKEDIPTEWHYSNNRRVAPVIAVADDGWVMVHDENQTVTDRGAHGYSVSSDEMKGIFVAWGPNIVANTKSQPVVREIDIFPLIAEILKLESKPEINGSLERVRWMIRNKNNDDNVFSSLIMVCVLALLCALAVCIVISCAHYHAKSIHLQKVGKTYALQTGKLMRRRQNRSDKSIEWNKFNKNTKKKSRAQAADTAFLMESSSGNDDDILGDVEMGQRKVSS